MFSVNWKRCFIAGFIFAASAVADKRVVNLKDALRELRREVADWYRLDPELEPFAREYITKGLPIIAGHADGKNFSVPTTLENLARFMWGLDYVTRVAGKGHEQGAWILPDPGRHLYRWLLLMPQVVKRSSTHMKDDQQEGAWGVDIEGVFLDKEKLELKNSGEVTVLPCNKRHVHFIGYTDKGTGERKIYIKLENYGVGGVSPKGIAATVIHGIEAGESQLHKKLGVQRGWFQVLPKLGDFREGIPSSVNKEYQALFGKHKVKAISKMFATVKAELEAIAWQLEEQFQVERSPREEEPLGWEVAENPLELRVMLLREFLEFLTQRFTNLPERMGNEVNWVPANYQRKVQRAVKSLNSPEEMPTVTLAERNMIEVVYDDHFSDSGQESDCEKPGNKLEPVAKKAVVKLPQLVEVVVQQQPKVVLTKDATDSAPSQEQEVVKKDSLFTRLWRNVSQKAQGFVQMVRRGFDRIKTNVRNLWLAW